MDKAQHKYSPYEIISYVFMGCFILLGFLLHLMPMLIAGFVIFFMTTWVYSKVKPIVRGGLANTVTILLITFISVIVICAIVLGLYHAIHSKSIQLDDFEQNMYQLFQQFKTQIPPALGKYIPDDMLEFKDSMIALMKSSSANIVQVTSNSAKLFAHIVIGLILGALVAFSLLSSKEEEPSKKPLIIALKARLSSFAKIFSLVIFAQFKIALVNTILTAIYFFALLPLFGIHIPYAKTMVLLTFLLGLIPIIGNLVVNIIVVAISLTISIKVAVASLIFLILVHKLEYYINAKVVGGNLRISIWELLIAMIILESLFGIMGVVLGPVVYGYIKEELKHKQLV